MPQIRPPAILWGDSFANRIFVQYPLDNWNAYSQPRDGYRTRQAMSGVEDALWIGQDYYLRGEIRWVPTDTVTNVATGWDGTTGWRAFLEWAALKNQFRWCPDSANLGAFVLSYLVEPITAMDITVELDNTRRIPITIRNPTTPYTGY